MRLTVLPLPTGGLQAARYAFVIDEIGVDGQDYDEATLAEISRILHDFGQKAGAIATLVTVHEDVSIRHGNAIL